MLEKIHKATLNLMSTYNLEEIYKVIVEEAMKLTKAKHGTMYLYKDGELERVYASSPVLYKVVPNPKGNMQTILDKLSKKIITAEEITKLHPQLKKLNIGSDLSISINYKGASLGVLSVLSDKDVVFGKKEMKALHYFQPVASLAIRNAMLFGYQQKIIKDKDLFTALAAHELRTPLTTTNTYIQLLNRSNNLDKSKIQKYLKRAQAATKKLERLIDELLESAKFKAGKLVFNMKSTDITKLLLSVVNDFKLMFPAQRITYKKAVWSKKSIVFVDPGKIRQVILNILNNAVKFTGSKTDIEVRLKEQENKFIITIKDKGIGIDRLDLEEIFQPYFRAQNNTTDKGGLGLGLFLAKKIIDKHKGKISISSKINRGTTVRIELKKNERKFTSSESKP
jgi:signal transduction histidine kinase